MRAAVSEQTGDYVLLLVTLPAAAAATAAPHPCTSFLCAAVSEQTGDYVLVERDDVVKALASFIAEYIGALSALWFGRCSQFGTTGGSLPGHSAAFVTSFIGKHIAVCLC